MKTETSSRNEIISDDIIFRIERLVDDVFTMADVQAEIQAKKMLLTVLIASIIILEKRAPGRSVNLEARFFMAKILDKGLVFF